jgi:hypothetical protein
VGHKKGKLGAKTGVSAKLRDVRAAVRRRDARRHAKSQSIWIEVGGVRCAPCVGAQRASHAGTSAAGAASSAPANRARAIRSDSRARLRDFSFVRAVSTPAPRR